MKLSRWRDSVQLYLWQSYWPHPNWLMKQYQLPLTLILASLVVSGTFAATVIQQERKTKKVRRVQRPKFTQRDWDGVYFENLFEEGLVGDRPEKADPAMMAESTQNNSNAAANADSANSSQSGWSEVVGRTTLEDEIKALQLQLATQITTPIKFKTEYGKAHQSFSMLSMMFAIIREYDDEVRWKKFGAAAQASFQKAAANSRVGTTQAFESCRTRKMDLEELVRGGNFASDDPVPDALDWSNVVDHSPIMDRLSESRDRMKEMTSAEGEFKSRIDELMHEAELVAAMSQVLIKENMPYADEDGYVEFAIQMSQHAEKISAACKNQDYEVASKFANAVRQSCDDCHGEYQ